MNVEPRPTASDSIALELVGNADEDATFRRATWKCYSRCPDSEVRAILRPLPFANFGIQGHSQVIDLVWLWFRSPNVGLAATDDPDSERAHRAHPTRSHRVGWLRPPTKQGNHGGYAAEVKARATALS